MRRKQPASLDGLMNDDEAPLQVPAAGQASAFDVSLRREQNEHIAAGMQHLPMEYRGSARASFSGRHVSRRDCRSDARTTGYSEIQNLPRPERTRTVVKRSAAVSTDVHERARSLIAWAGPEGLSGADQTWLASHVETCASCRAFARTPVRLLTRCARSQLPRNGVWFRRRR